MYTKTQSDRAASIWSQTRLDRLVEMQLWFIENDGRTSGYSETLGDQIEGNSLTIAHFFAGIGVATGHLSSDFVVSNGQLALRHNFLPNAVGRFQLRFS